MKKVFVQLEAGRGYGRDLLKGIYEYNHRSFEWEIVFEPAYYLKVTETRDIVSMISLLEPDGCILEKVQDMDRLAELEIPVILASAVGQRNSNIPCIMGDYDADGKMAADYFIRMGFKNLGFFGVDKLEWSKNRLESFRYYAGQRQIPVFEHMFKTLTTRNLRNNFDDLIRWIRALAKPVGILCCNDDFAQILANACSMGGINVPNEIAILGVDNDDLLCNITSPKLSSIARNQRKAAFKACELLNRMMQGEKHVDRVIPNTPLEVVVRASTNTIACNDPEVVKALYYIRQHVNLPLNVDDVVKATCLSRRSLYARFRKVTGNTIYDEIQLEKLKMFKRLLQNQGISIKEAMFTLGFTDVSHVSRWFSSLEGMSPTKWRNTALSLSRGVG